MPTVEKSGNASKKHRIIIWFNNSEYTHKRTESKDLKRYLYIHVHSIIHNSQKVEIIQMSMSHMYTRNMVTHKMYYYSALKSNEILIKAKTWMNLGNMMPSERSQSQRTNYMISQITGTEVRMVVIRDWGRTRLKTLPSTEYQYRMIQKCIRDGTVVMVAQQ